MSWDLKIVNGSFQLAPDGDLERVTGLSKLSQDVVKIVVTPTGTTRAHPWYGSVLSSRITGSALADGILQTETETAVNNAVQNLLQLQQQQERGGQYLAPDEAISRIVNVSVERSQFDARQLDVAISIKTRSGRVVVERIGVSL